MSDAYLPVMIAALIPLFLAGLAKAGGLRSGVRYDNASPRESLARLSGWAQRANWAQQNSWEAFPVFAVAVLVALQSGVEPGIVARWGWIFILLRGAYIVCYLLGFASLRSLCWVAGFAVCLGLMARIF